MEGCSRSEKAGEWCVQRQIDTRDQMYMCVLKIVLSILYHLLTLVVLDSNVPNSSVITSIAGTTGATVVIARSFSRVDRISTALCVGAYNVGLDTCTSSCMHKPHKTMCGNR